jgi:hypothetical protein
MQTIDFIETDRRSSHFRGQASKVHVNPGAHIRFPRKAHLVPRKDNLTPHFFENRVLAAAVERPQDGPAAAWYRFVHHANRREGATKNAVSVLKLTSSSRLLDAISDRGDAWS